MFLIVFKVPFLLELEHYVPKPTDIFLDTFDVVVVA